MLTLITGVPGSGKTAAAVDLLVREYKDRLLYVDGLNGLTVQHEPCDVLNWHNDVPDGAIVVVDEVQRKWRPRGPGSKVPESVAALETHRHRGLDFILITQNPRLLDSNVRALVGRHVHIRDTGWAGRWWYEWPECSTECAWRTCQNKRRYKLPKHVFSLYTSASLHVKPVRKLPLMLWFLLAAAIILGFLLYKSAGAFQTGEEKSLPSSATNQAQPGQDAKAVGGKGAVVYDYGEFIPRLSNRPETAPAFDALRVVQTMPIIKGGICRKGECQCFTQQGTNAGLTSAECKDWMENRPFDAYSPPEPVQQAPHQPQSPQSAEPAQAVAAADKPAAGAVGAVTKADQTFRLAAAGAL